MAALFAIALFLSAFLLFWVEPMIAKMVLPLLGGTPAVWNTCLVFFQAMLLAGYAYAHVASKGLPLRRQILIQLGLLLAAAVTLPIALSPNAFASIPLDSNPSFWLLACLFASVGLPFFAVSSNGPLLQRWFSYLRHNSAQDPYYLYAASNVGSLLALLAYPLCLEPGWRLGDQSRLWAMGFIALIALVFACALTVLWGASWDRLSANGLKQTTNAAEQGTGGLTSRQRARWCLLSLVPSSLMLGLTSYLTTDIASIPLLWVLPLALYLLTFILAFARSGSGSVKWTSRLLSMGVIAVGYMLLSEATHPAWLIMPVHLAVFFLAALLCHSQLADERPSPTHLTEFYLWISIGGVVGGMFNAFIAPLLFSRIAEYPLGLVLACWLRPRDSAKGMPTRQDRWLNLIFPASVALLVAMLARAPLGELPLQARLALLIGLPLIVCYLAVDRPARFALSIGAVMLASSFLAGTHGHSLAVERNFYGVVRVTRDPNGPFYRLVHGNTTHGRERIDPGPRPEPLSYYYRTGPVGQIFKAYRAHPASTNVAVVGLGAGSMASYAGPYEKWTFYEINPAVLRVAGNTNFFTFMKCCGAPHEVLLGDARLRLREAPSAQYGLLVLDAFSSDAIPLHLVTREALQLYVSKLAPGGLLVFHISNRCLDLEGVLADLASDAHLVCRSQDEVEPDASEIAAGKDQSHWMVMARRVEDLGMLRRDARWLPVSRRAKPQVWTDDFSNIISVFRWN